MYIAVTYKKQLAKQPLILNIYTIYLYIWGDFKK